MFGREKSFNKKENDQNSIDKNSEKPENNSRRDFIKKISALMVGAAIAETPLKAFALESNEKPPIVTRPSWDNEWNETSKQYALKLGEKFQTKYGEKTSSVLPYFNENFASGRSSTLDSNRAYESLKNVYRRCAVHHTDIDTSGVGAYDQAKKVRDIELGSMGFNDTGYHFLIASDGTILEGRPAGRVGSNAGQTLEANTAAKALGGISAIANATSSNEYYSNLQKYVKAMKMDPDYGTLGIALCGDFDTGNQPSRQQQESLIKLLNWVKCEYDIPTNNIIYHREVKSKVIEASGLTFVGTNGATDTVCPGRSFPDISNFKNKLNRDTQNAQSKTILLDKTI